MDYKNWKIEELDIEIIRVLSKFSWLHDYHVSVFTGENRGYIRGRLKQLSVAGLVRREQLKAGKPACNWVTMEGLNLIGEKRTVRTPTMSLYAHNLGVADMICWLTMPVHGKDKKSRILNLGSVITERDFCSAREMIAVGTKRDGTSIFRPADNDIHAPDAFYIKNDRYFALEFERTPKSTKDMVEANVHDLMKRFTRQYWFYENSRISKVLYEISETVPPGTIKVFNLSTSREAIMEYVDALPSVISKKSGHPRDSALGEMISPIALNHIPVLNHVVLENAQTLERVILE